MASCDVKGKPRQFEREMLFSKVDKVSDVAKQLSEANKVHARPASWDYRSTPISDVQQKRVFDAQLGYNSAVSKFGGSWTSEHGLSTRDVRRNGTCDLSSWLGTLHV